MVASTSRAYLDQCNFVDNSCGDITKTLDPNDLESNDSGEASQECDEGVDVWVDAARPVVRSKKGGIWV